MECLMNSRSATAAAGLQRDARVLRLLGTNWPGSRQLNCSNVTSNIDQQQVVRFVSR